MKIALGQINPVVGDIGGNSAGIADCISRSASAGAELVVFSELSVVGCPPGDLLRRERFVADSVAAVESLAKQCKGIAALVGFVRPAPGGSPGALQNAAALLAGGTVSHVYVKRSSAAYDFFDETRYFQPGRKPGCLELGGCRIGLSIGGQIPDAPGAEILINMSAEPFGMGGAALREELLVRRAASSGATIVYVNQAGGNDELIFGGGSCAVSAGGELLGRCASFREDLLVVDTAGPPVRCEGLGERMARLSAALKLGLRDYVTKCGFGSVVLGLSGGIDSAVVAALAADAIGPKNVFVLAMPGRYSSAESLTDARAAAENLGVSLQVAPIESIHVAYEQVLPDALAASRGDLAEQNIQARIRGNLLMALSNAFGHLPLATGNKSELSVGYCTLYGDMTGGLAVIGDVLKTAVFKLAEQLNAEAGEQRIPQRVITKPPSAELKPNQLDQDKLPPYELLDGILSRYIEADRTAEQIVAEGFDAGEVDRVIRMVDAAEFKRWQAPPALKVTRRAFGAGRRMPIAQRYDSQGGK